MPPKKNANLAAKGAEAEEACCLSHPGGAPARLHDPAGRSHEAHGGPPVAQRRVRRRASSTRVAHGGDAVSTRAHSSRAELLVHRERGSLRLFRQ